MQTAVERRTVGRSRQSRWATVLVLMAVAAGVIYGGWKWSEIRCYRRAMAGIKREIQAGRHGHAAEVDLAFGVEARLKRGRLLVGSVREGTRTAPGSVPSLGTGLPGFITRCAGNSRAHGDLD